MEKEIKKNSTIEFNIGLDENHVPVKMDWKASDAGEGGECKAFMIAIWDEKEETTMRIDLWNKEMRVDEMKKFIHQSLLTMSDSFERATGEKEMALDMKDFAKYFGERMGVIATENS